MFAERVLASLRGSCVAASRAILLCFVRGGRVVTQTLSPCVEARRRVGEDPRTVGTERTLPAGLLRPLGRLRRPYRTVRGPLNGTCDTRRTTDQCSCARTASYTGVSPATNSNVTPTTGTS